MNITNPEPRVSFRRIRSWIQCAIPPFDGVHHLAVHQLREVQVVAAAPCPVMPLLPISCAFSTMSPTFTPIDDRCA